MSGYPSPSLGKMEAMGRREPRPRRHFSPGRILGDPFALATVSIAILGWLISFIASIISSVNPSPNHPYQNICWWTVAYYICVIIGLLLAVAFDSVYNYHVAIVGFLAYGLFLSTASVDNTIYIADGAYQASAAGFILLSVVAIIWVFYYGSQPQATHRGFIDSFALHGNQRGPMSPQASRHISNNQFGQPDRPQAGSQFYKNRSNLAGFETSSPEQQYPNPTASTSRGSPALQQQSRFAGPTSPQGFGPAQPQAPGSSVGQTDEPPQTADYTYKARAIYSYEANPDDANEISFQKHEILDVSDVSGRWWQARKQTGETGIAPSNYLILL